jgi:hypothetical protein
MDFYIMGYREEPFVWEKYVVQVFYAPDLGNNEGRHIVLQSKWKIIGVNNTTEEQGNGYQDMPAVGADVELRLFEEGMEPTYVRVEHHEAIIIPSKHLLYLNFIVLDVLYYGYKCQRNKWYHHTTMTIQFSSCYDNTSI